MCHPSSETRMQVPSMGVRRRRLVAGEATAFDVVNVTGPAPGGPGGIARAGPRPGTPLAGTDSVAWERHVPTATDPAGDADRPRPTRGHVPPLLRAVRPRSDRARRRAGRDPRPPRARGAARLPAVARPDGDPPPAHIARRRPRHERRAHARLGRAVAAAGTTARDGARPPAQAG